MSGSQHQHLLVINNLKSDNNKVIFKTQNRDQRSGSFWDIAVEVEDIGRLLASSARDMPVEALPLTCTLSNTILASTSNRPAHTSCANIIISSHHIVILIDKTHSYETFGQCCTVLHQGF